VSELSFYYVVDDVMTSMQTPLYL